MPTLAIRRINCADPGAPEQLAALRAQLASQAEVVSPRGRQLTEAVFGEALSPARVVERVCADVRTRGLAAVLHYSEQFDCARLDKGSLRVGEADLAAAHAAADPAFLAAVRRVRQNVLAFQLGILHADAVLPSPTATSCGCATGRCAASASASPAAPPPTPAPCS